MFALVLSMTVLAQPGSWGGYVSGWRYDSPPVRAPLRRFIPIVVAPAPVFPSLVETHRADAAADAAARERLLALETARLAQQREAALAEAQARVLAREEQLLAQQQALLVEQRQRELAAAEARAQADRAEALRREQEAREAEVVARERARLEDARAEAARGGSHGPDIHTWVDEDGVTHFSTRPRR